VNHATILIVEKDLTLARELQELLTEVGFIVKLANTVEAILEVVGNNKFDLILLDASFPEISGVKVFQDIQYSCPNCQTILSFNSYSYDIKKIISELRIAATIQKPFELDSLLELFTNHSRPPMPQKSMI
jgi:DNA-binding NtrC family response regulator